MSHLQVEVRQADEGLPLELVDRQREQRRPDLLCRTARTGIVLAGTTAVAQQKDGAFVPPAICCCCVLIIANARVLASSSRAPVPSLKLLKMLLLGMLATAGSLTGWSGGLPRRREPSWMPGFMSIGDIGGRPFGEASSGGGGCGGRTSFTAVSTASSSSTVTAPGSLTLAAATPMVSFAAAADGASPGMSTTTELQFPRLEAAPAFPHGTIASVVGRVLGAAATRSQTADGGRCSSLVCSDIVPSPIIRHSWPSSWLSSPSSASPPTGRYPASG